MLTTAAPWKIEVVRRIADVPADTWDAIGAGRPFVSHRWLGLAESVLAGHEPRYVLLERNGRLEAAAVCAVQRHVQHPGLQRVAGGLLRHFPSLRCAIPIAFVPGLLIPPGADEPRLAAGLLAAIERLAARERAPFTKVEYLAPAAATWPALRRAGYHQIDMWPDTAVEIAWTSFDAYVSHLPRRKQRDINRIRQRAADEGITVAPLHPTASTAPRLWQLFDNVMRRHGAMETYHPDLFLRASAILGPELLVLAARRQGEIVGCASLLTSGHETTAKWLGLDYGRTWGTATYLTLLMECIAQAIASGTSRLCTGATADETKRHLGARPEARSGAVLVRGRLFNHLAGAVVRRSRG
jgi:predicted N-acyltransferase